MENPFEEKQRTLHDYINIIFRRKWTILLIFMVVLGRTLYIILTKPPEYLSMATIVTKSTEVVFPGTNALSMKESVRPFEFYEAIVGSRSFKQRVVAALIDSCSRYPEIQLTLTDAQSLVEDNLVISNLEYQDFIGLKAKAYSPQLAYLLAEVGTLIFKARCQEIEQEESQNVVNYVENQKLIAQEELESIERSLQEFLKRTDTALLGKEDGGVVNKMMDMEEQLAAIKTQRELAEANLRAYEQRLAQLESKLEAELGQSEDPQVKVLQKELSRLDERKNYLVQEFGPSHHEIKLIDKEVEAKKKELIRIMMAATGINNMSANDEKPIFKDLQERKITEELNIFILGNREKYYRNFIENYKKKHPNMLEHAIEIARLNRSKAVRQNMYNFLLEKGEEAKIKAATGTGGIRIMDPPILPNRPVPSRAKMDLMVAILVGLGLGFGVALFQEYMDHSIRSTEDVTRYLELPVMGVVPIIQNQNGMPKTNIVKNWKRMLNPRKEGNSNNGQDAPVSSMLISHLKPKNPLVETYRGLRTNLQFAALDESIQSIVVTSPNPREGKTITSANLAISFSEMGLQTILVDADLRRPQQHKLFQVDRSPGLSDWMVNDMELLQVMHVTGIPNLRLIPSGKIPPNPTGVLGSKKMQNLIEQLHKSSDMLIFDSPPILALTDALLLGPRVSGILLVIKFGQTNHNAARNALDILTKAKLNVLGVVLNSTLISRGYGYYQYYYNYYYDSESGEKKKKVS